MQKHYFTFGLTTENKDNYQLIVANDSDTARKLMFDRHGEVWSSEYSEQEWAEVTARNPKMAALKPLPTIYEAEELLRQAKDLLAKSGVQFLLAHDTLDGESTSVSGYYTLKNAKCFLGGMTDNLAGDYAEEGFPQEFAKTGIVAAVERGIQEGYERANK